MSWEQLIAFQGWSAISWGIIHSLWLGLIVFGVALVAQSLWPDRPRRLGFLYNVLLLTLAGSTVAIMIGYGWENHENAISLPSIEQGALLSASSPTPETPIVTLSEKIDNWVHRHQVWIGIGYLLGALFYMGSILFGYWRINKLKQAPTLSHDHLLYQCMQSIADKMGITKPVRLVETSALTVPATLGHWRPFIFLPEGLSATLSVRELEAILAHELAHIARHDYLSYWLQQWGRTLLFYHPVVHWLMAEIDTCREAACDDLATAATGDKAALANALAQVSSYSMHSAEPLLALGRKRQPLLLRVKRLLGHSTSLKTNTMNRSSIVIAALLLAGIIMLAAAPQAKTVLPVPFLTSAVTVDTPPPAPPTPPPPPLPPVPENLDLPQTPVLPPPPAMPADRSEATMEAWGDAMEEWGEQVGELMEEWGESFGESFAQMEAEWDEDYAEQMRAFGEEMRQWAEAYQGDFARSMRDMEREIRIMEREIREEQKADHEDKMATQLKAALKQDGLWQEGEPLDLHLDATTMRVNGEAQSADMHEKYVALLEQIHGQSLNGEFDIHIVLD